MKIGLHMIAAGDADSVVACVKSQQGLMDCGIILVDSGAYSDELYSKLVSLDIPNLIVRRHLWQDSFAQARNEALEMLLESFPDIDYIYWVDGDDLWDSSADIKTIREKLEKERPEAVNIIYKYSDSFEFYRNRFWRVVDGKSPYIWKGAAHEVELAVGDTPVVSNWPEFKLIHTREHSSLPDVPKRDRNIKMLLREIDLDPEYSRSYYYVGQEFIDNGDYDKGIFYLIKFLGMDANIAEKYQAHLMLIKAFIAKKDYILAEAEARRAIALYPKSQFAYTYLGDIYRLQDQWEEAAYWYQAALGAPGAPVIFDAIAQRTIIPTRWLSVCYSKLGDKEQAAFYHYLAGKCKVSDGLQRYNSLWVANNRYLEAEHPLHFKMTEKYKEGLPEGYLVVNEFNNTIVKKNIVGLIEFNPQMVLVRIVDEGSDNEIAIFYTGVEDYNSTITIGERYKLQTIDYKKLYHSEQLSLYEDFYVKWLKKAVSFHAVDKEIIVVELGTNIGLSARLFRNILTKIKGSNYKLTLVDAILTKETWAILKDPNNPSISFIKDLAENAVRQFKDKSIDILHMDLAPHSYEQAVAIFNLYLPKLSKKGIMLWHDVGKSRDFKFGGRRFIDELRYPWCISYCAEHESLPDVAPAVIFREVS